MTEEVEFDTEQEQLEESGPAPVQPSFQMGLTPFGKIGINITDTNGQTAGYVIQTPSEAWEIAGHLLAIATMMVQTYYAAAAQEQAEVAKILQQSKLWKPGD